MTVYINLYHGRTDPDVDIDDWGMVGPTLGPFDYVTTTYLHNIRASANNNFNIYTFDTEKDMLLYDGVYYGDWSISATPINEPQFPKVVP